MRFEVVVSLVGFAILIAIMSLFALAPPRPTLISVAQREYVVTRVMPPKHFRFDLRDVVTGEEHNSVPISKHCHNWRKLEVGSIWSLEERTYQRPDGTQFRTVVASYAVCEALGEKP